MTRTDGICREVKDTYIRNQCELPPESLAERKKEEPKEVGKLVADALFEAGEHHVVEKGAVGVLESVLPKAASVLGKAAHVLGPVVAGAHALYETTKLSNLIGEQGHKRGVAVSRENHDLAMNFVAFEAKPDVMPKGYLEARRETLLGPNGKIGDNRHSPHVVNAQIDQIENGIEAKDSGMTAYRDAWVSGLQNGQHAAHAAGITDDDSLEAARTNEKFEANYTQNPAFREGVRAAMWQAKNHPQDFAAEKAKLVAIQDSVHNAAARRSA